jgi:hypothetical protein
VYGVTLSGHLGHWVLGLEPGVMMEILMCYFCDGEIGYWLVDYGRFFIMLIPICCSVMGSASSNSLMKLSMDSLVSPIQHGTG